MKHLDEIWLTAEEAACVTGVPLEEVRVIVDADMLAYSTHAFDGVKMIRGHALFGLRFAHETKGYLAQGIRRRLTRRVSNVPFARTIGESIVTVDLMQMKRFVRKGLAALDNAKRMIRVEGDGEDSVPCFKGTGVPVHKIARLKKNGSDASKLLDAYPGLSEKHLEAASIYAKAYPRGTAPHILSM